MNNIYVNNKNIIHCTTKILVFFITFLLLLIFNNKASAEILVSEEPYFSETDESASLFLPDNSVLVDRSVFSGRLSNGRLIGSIRDFSVNVRRKEGTRFLYETPIFDDILFIEIPENEGGNYIIQAKSKLNNLYYYYTIDYSLIFFSSDNEIFGKHKEEYGRDLDGWDSSYSVRNGKAKNILDKFRSEDEVKPGYHSEFRRSRNGSAKPEGENRFLEKMADKYDIDFTLPQNYLPFPIRFVIYDAEKEKEDLIRIAPLLEEAVSDNIEYKKSKDNQRILESAINTNFTEQCSKEDFLYKAIKKGSKNNSILSVLSANSIYSDGDRCVINALGSEIRIRTGSVTNIKCKEENGGKIQNCSIVHKLSCIYNSEFADAAFLAFNPICKIFEAIPIQVKGKFYMDDDKFKFSGQW